uniref:Putative baseplate protein n=1 Tax=viral metagenome TaxID=1070528 RepID=A0A6M3M030_9ZZZZ
MHCKQCNTSKDAAEFYKSTPNRCKECIKERVRAHRQENLERVRAYDRMRGSMPHRVAAREEYRKTPAFAKSHEAAVKRWGARHPERKRASTAVHNAIRDGKLIPWPVCAVPECCGKPHGHHPDYSRPLDVVWLCDKHHKEAHALVKLAA